MSVVMISNNIFPADCGDICRYEQDDAPWPSLSKKTPISNYVPNLLSATSSNDN